MTGLLRPFVGYIPASKYGSRIVGPPSATLTAAQRKATTEDPLSFRQSVGRKAGCSTKEALGWINDRVSHGELLERGPGVLVYRQRAGDFVAQGIIADLSLDAYQSGRVKRHEKTIAKTQHRMAEYMRTTRVYGNPPVTLCRPDADFEQSIATIAAGEPDSTFTTLDDNRHEMWFVPEGAADDLCGQIDSEVYISDGHHRLAAAALVASEERCPDARIPVGVFSANEFRLRAFARCITDPELDAETVIANLNTEFHLDEVPPVEASPRSPSEFGAKIGDRYFRLRIPDDRIPDDPYGSLNTNLIQDLVLGPVLGITRPRLDKRLRFVADIDDRGEVCPSADAWLLPFPLAVSDVMMVADSERTMPAKSTWFAPKLPSGLVIRPLDNQ